MDEKSAKEFREAVFSQSNENSEKPLIVTIDTRGGDVYALASMVETMRSVPNPIITSCSGKAFSAGAILLSYGLKRYCGPHSRIMIHEMVGWTEGNIHEVQADSEEFVRINQCWLGELARNCKIEGGYNALKELIKNSKDNRTIRLTPEEAVKFGIVDGIGIPIIEIAYNLIVTVAPNYEKNGANDEPEKSS